MLSSVSASQPLTDCVPRNGSPSERSLLGQAHGIYDALEFIGALESHGIHCCLVGVSALIFYGAERARHAWEICVPTEALDDAVNLLSTSELSSVFPRTQDQPMPQPASLAHTYPRYRKSGSRSEFVLISSHDAHLDFTKSKLQRSSNGLPYPALPLLVQSFIDTYNEVALCDIIDGSNVSEAWGIENLDLRGTNDVEWAQGMNKRLREHHQGPNPVVTLFPTGRFAKSEMWKSKVNGKTNRLGWTRPAELFETRFWMKGTKNPWEIHRHSC